MQRYKRLGSPNSRKLAASRSDLWRSVSAHWRLASLSNRHLILASTLLHHQQRHREFAD